MIAAATTPDGVSILRSRPGCAYIADGKRSGLKAGDRIAADTSSGRAVSLTVHSARKAREWWALTDAGVWFVVRAIRPTSVAQMRTMNGPQRVYRRDKRGRFAS